MNNDDLFRAIGEINERDLEKADRIDLRKAVRRSARARIFAGIGVAVAVLVIVLGSGLLDPANHMTGPGTNTSSAENNSVWTGADPEDKVLLASLLVSDAIYPETDPYPSISDYTDKNGNIDYTAFSKAESDWRRRWFSIDVDTESVDCVQKAAEGLSRVVLKDADSNMVFSPLTVYMSLGMLSETAGGKTQAQILDVLGSDSTEDVRETVQWLWDYIYRDDDVSSTVMANSLWLDSSLKYKKDTLARLSESYMAQSFYGQMGSDELNNALQSWFRVNTRGLLDTDSFNTDPEDLLAIVSSLYFHAGWNGEFSEKDTTEEIFYGASGKETAAFMHKNDILTYYRGKAFSAVSLELNNYGDIWFVLPDEGASPADIAQDQEYYDLVFGKKQFSENGLARAIVDLSLPKFDVASDIDLDSSLKTLGVVDAFNPEVSDFSGVLSKGSATLSAKQSTRVVIDEKGVTAASVAMMDVFSSGTDLKVEVNFNRPFLFVINGPQSIPLFTGIVNDIE